MSERLPAVINTEAFLGFVERAMRDDSFDVAKFQALLSEYRLERDRIKRDAFNRAMAEVQSQIDRIRATGKNPTFNNPYATLADLDRDARPVYTAHGFAVRFGSALTDRTVPPPAPGEVRAVLIISHTDGHEEQHHLDGPKDTQTGARGRTGIQAVGSSVTYLRRYLLMMVLNLVQAGDPTDDDGEASRRRQPPPKPPANEWPTERLQRVQAAINACANSDALADLRGRSEALVAAAPADIRARIELMFSEGFATIAKRIDPDLAALCDEADAMTLDDLENVGRNGAWNTKVSKLFPPDQDTLAGHIEMRKQELRSQNRE